MSATFRPTLVSSLDSLGDNVAYILRILDTSRRTPCGHVMYNLVSFSLLQFVDDAELFDVAVANGCC